MKLNEIKSKSDFLTDPKEIENWLHRYNIKGYTIHDDGTVDVHEGNHQGSSTGVNFTGYKLSKIAVKFGKVDGIFILQEHKQLKTLKGCPDIVTDMFCVYDCPLIDSLEFAPKKVRDMSITKSKLTSYENVPELINVDNGSIAIYDTLTLTSLRGCPEKMSDICVASCPNLTSLEHGPKDIIGNYRVQETGITSLKGIAPKLGYELNIAKTKITSLRGIHNLIEFRYEGGAMVYLEGTPIKDGLIDLMRVKNFGHVGDEVALEGDLRKACEIINKHAGNGRAGIIDAQDELYQEDLENFI